MNAHDHADHADHQASAAALPGLSLSAPGIQLSPLHAPTEVGTDGTLSFQLLDERGGPIIAVDTVHERALHLIIVRSDGQHFAHVHPVLDSDTGTWSLPWRWEAAGSYRVFVDVAPTGIAPTTLTRTVHVAGDFTPADVTPHHTVETAGLTFALTGQMQSGQPSALTITVTRDGAPVTELEPYLGAFGHLIALREGDFAFLHVHAEGDDARAGTTSGPELVFVAHAPTPGLYLLYLDVQLDGVVYTAPFVLTAAPSDDAAPAAPMDHRAH